MADLFKTLALPVTTPTETLVAGTVDFYQPGTTGESNRKDVYTDAAGTIIAANPYTLDANATATLYGTGLYHIVIKNSLGATAYDYDYITPDQILFVYNPPSLADLQATTGYDGAVVNMIYRTSIGDGGGGQFYWDSSDLSTQVTADTLHGIYVPPDSDNTGASGAWVRVINDGTILLDWFKSNTVPGTTDMTAAINAAIALNSLYPKIRGKGVYKYSSTINVTSTVEFIGEGTYVAAGSLTGTVFLKDAALNGDGFYVTGLGVVFRDLSFEGETGNGGDNLVINGGRCYLENVGSFNAGQDGIRIGVTSGGNSNVFNFVNIRTRENGRHGVMIDDKTRPTLPDANGGCINTLDTALNGECGVYLGNNILNTFINIVAQTNGTYGLYSSASSQQNTFLGGDYEVNGRGGGSSTSYYDFFIESGSVDNKLFAITCYNFPQSFICNEVQNLIVGLVEGAYSGDNQYDGIQLPNIASDVATVLDWYEEGTFTPIIEGTSTVGAGTYSIQVGKFTRIGDTVHISIGLTWSAHTGTGNMVVTGLPYTSGSTVNFVPVAIVPGNITNPASSIVAAMIPASSETIKIYSVSTAGTATTSDLAMDTAGTFWITGQYMV